MGGDWPDSLFYVFQGDVMDAEPSKLLDRYPHGTALIRYEEGGAEKLWFIGAHPEKDNESTLRGHLIMYKPKAKFLGWAIK